MINNWIAIFLYVLYVTNIIKCTSPHKKNSELHIRNADSFNGNKIKMVVDVFMLTECVLLCEDETDCDFSVLGTQNCTLYSMKSGDKMTDRNEMEESNVEGETEIKCKKVAFKKREDSIKFDAESTTNSCTAKYAYELQGCYNKCGRKTGWCPNYCGVDKACCRADIPDDGEDRECILTSGAKNNHECMYGSRHGALGNKTYVFVNFVRSFEQSRNRCNNIGADLTSVDSREELAYINSLMTKDYYLVGYQKPNGTTQWRWNNDENFEPTWCPAAVETHSNLIGHYYGLVYRPKMCMDWINRDRHRSYNFICEKTNEI